MFIVVNEALLAASSKFMAKVVAQSPAALGRDGSGQAGLGVIRAGAGCYCSPSMSIILALWP